MKKLIIILMLSILLCSLSIANAITQYEESENNVPIGRIFGATVSDKIKEGEWHE